MTTNDVELREREGLLPTIQEDVIIRESESPLAAVLRQKRTPINRRMTRSGALKSRTLSHKEPSEQGMFITVKHNNKTCPTNRMR